MHYTGKIISVLHKSLPICYNLSENVYYRIATSSCSYFKRFGFLATDTALHRYNKTAYCTETNARNGKFYETER